MNRVVETMTRVVCGGYGVRVWREAKEGVVGPDLDVFRALNGLWEWGAVIGALENLEGVAAYEIVDGDGNGVVVYPDWK